MVGSITLLLSLLPMLNLLPDSPFSQEAEQAVLGAVIMNPASFLSVSAFLKAEDFFLLRHSYLWQAMHQLHERREDIDTLTLREELRRMSVLDEIGGMAYITQLVSLTPTSAHVEIYGRIVERTAIRRRLMATADEIRALATNEELTVEQIASESEAKLFNVTDRQTRNEFTTMNTAVNDYFDRIEHLMQSQQLSMGVPSGFRDLDALLGGFQKSDLLIFAGRPGMGKTSFMLTTAVNMARLGARVAFFTMEMGVDQLVQRMVSMETGIGTQQLRLGKLNPQEYARFVEAAGRISRFPIYIDDTPALNPVQIRTKTRRLQHEYGIDAVFVDYLQLMNAGGSYQNNRVQEVSYISRAMKELARELSVPVFSAAQLSRAVESRQDKRPVLSDLRESGCVTGDSLVYLPESGDYVPIRDLKDKTGYPVLSLNTETYRLEPGTVTRFFSPGVQPVYRLETALGRTIRATVNHKFYTIDGWKRLDALSSEDHIALPGFSVPEEAKDVYWDQIVSIQPDGEEEVYDITVEGHHSYVCNDIVISNSIEQDADIVMFLYRDAIYNEATEFPNQADIIVAKHRNGPTGVISLYFEQSLTKFIDGVTRRVDLKDTSSS